MKKVALVIDSSFGITNGAYKDVYTLPLIINEVSKDGILTYHDGVDISAKELIAKLNKGIDIKTNQSIPGEIMNLLEKLTIEYENIYVLPIPLTISSGFNT
jgi:fatty acid-binding protein DegV